MADSRIVKRRVDDSYRCGYCNQPFSKLEDPRTFPCLHVYCMRCLTMDRKTHIKCAYCGEEFYEITDPTMLPVTKFGDPIEYTSSPKHVPIPCDVCEDETEAVVFCIESEKKLCEQHQQKHDEAMNTYLNSKHQFIPIDVYTASPQRYTTTNCEHHEHHQLIEACSECLQMFCIQCDSKSECGKVTEGKAASHNVTSLNDLSRELRDKMAEEMKILSEKISELNDISKDAWKLLSEIEDDVKRMLARVYAKMEEIRKKAKELKQELSEYMRSSTEMVVNYRYDLAVKHGVDKLSLVERVQHAVDKFNDAGIVKDYKEMSEKMEKALDISVIEKCSVPRKFLTSANSKDSLGLTLLSIGTAYLQSDGLPVRGWFDGLNITADGHLMCSSSKGIDILDRHTLDIISSVKDTKTARWIKIIQPEGVMVGICYNKKEATYEVALLDPHIFKKTKSLYKQPGHVFRNCAIAHQFSLVYIVDRKEKQLVVCSLVDNKIQKFLIPGVKYPVSVCILSDSTLIIGDLTKVIRYKVENTTLTLMWEFPLISGPNSIIFDPTSELIHICTSRGPLLILSLEGKLMQTFSRESLGLSGENRMEGMAVYNGDKVFLVCSDGLRRYTIKY